MPQRGARAGSRESHRGAAHRSIARLGDLVGDGLARLGVADDARVVLAVSGGSDSMALLRGAAEQVASGVRGWQLSVAHLDHRLREGSADDAAFVVAAGAELHVPVEIATADVASGAAASGRSIEETARDARYAFLESVAPPGAVIATAHTADDAVETVLINLLRGSGLAGARGIPARRGRVVRPLLDVRRDEVRRLVADAGIGYRHDDSNDDPAFLRNRIRGELLPLVEAIRPGATGSIARFARLAADDDDLLDALATAELERRRAPGGQIDWSEPPPRALARRVLRLAMGDPAPTAERIDALLDAVEGPRGGLTVEMGAGRTASVRGHRVRIG